MIWYLAAYATFWAVLFGYLLGVSSRQQKLVERAEHLTRRLAEGAGPGPGGHIGEARGTSEMPEGGS